MDATPSLNTSGLRADLEEMDLAVAVIVCPCIAVLWHEAAHAAFALATSRSPVLFQVGLGPGIGFTIGRVTVRIGPLPLGGFCIYDGDTGRADRALVAAAGPVSSAFLAALAWNLRHSVYAASPSGAFLLGQLAIVSAGMALITAVPMRYPARLARGGESDGLVVLSAVFPASRLVLIKVPDVEHKPERPIRAPFAIVLAAVIVVGFMASFWLGAVVLTFFGFIYAAERHG